MARSCLIKRPRVVNGGGKPASVQLSYLVVTISVLFFFTNAANASTEMVGLQVSAGIDDGFAWSSTEQDTTAGYLMIGDGRDYSSPYHISAMRFVDVNIPRGAPIIDARLKIKSISDGTKGQIYGLVQAESVDDAEGFGSRYIGSASRTTAAFEWDHKAAWATDTLYISPDITGAIQEVIDRPGWEPRNSVAILYSTRTDSGKSRMFGSFDLGLSYAPVLEITFETYTISGYVTEPNSTPIDNVTISAGNGVESVVTDNIGYYELIVPSGWSGTVTPSKIGLAFIPANRSYSNVTTDATDQNYEEYRPIICGYVMQDSVGLEAVTLSADNGGGSDTSDANGYYEVTIPYNWSGTVTPSKTNWQFVPSERPYFDVVTDQIGQDYTAEFSPYGGGSGTVDDPYLIFTANHMDKVAQRAGDWEKHFKLAADVDMSLCSNPNRTIIGEYLFLVPTAVKIDEEHGKLYFSDWAQDIIRRANLDGTYRECIVTGPSSQGLTLDTVNNKIYWTDVVGDKIQRANLDGSGIEDLVVTGLGAPGGIALDLSAGKMYWADRGTDKLQRANLDGSNVETLLSNLLDPWDLVIVPSLSKIYWTETSGNIIRRANLDGSNLEYVLTGLSYPWGIAVDSNSGYLYWSSHTGICRANLDGSDSVLLVPTSTGSMIDIAIDTVAGKMYWPENNTDNSYDKIVQANLDGSGLELLMRNFFTGTFEGNGHTIRNFALGTTGIDRVGIFGVLDSSDAVVKNVGVINPTIDAGNGERAGGLIGQIFAGKVENCFVKGGSISGRSLVGGLTGAGSDCTISNCYTQTTVTGQTYYVGGVMGLNFNASLSRCYAASPVQGDKYTGGLIGGGVSLAYADCFWDIEVSNQGTSDGGVGKTTAQMQKKSTFTNSGWDFFGETANGPNDVWRMCVDDVNYPRLAWEFDRFGDIACPDGVDNSDLEVMTSEWLKEAFSSNIDFYKDNKIDLLDWTVFAAAWGSTQGSPNYNSACDVCGDDGVIDGRDMAVFLHHWLQDSSYKPRADIAPVGGDGTVNNKDFNVLAENWMKGL